MSSLGNDASPKGYAIKTTRSGLLACITSIAIATIGLIAASPPASAANPIVTISSLQNPTVETQKTDLYAFADLPSGCSATNYAWNFGDGYLTSGPDLFDVTHGWKTAGGYDVTVVVTDNCGDNLKVGLTQTVVVDSPPNVVFATSVISVNPLTVSVDTSGTSDTDPAGPSGEIYVDWGDSWGSDNSAGGGLTHQYAQAGTYTVKVYVYDTVGKYGTAQHTITIGTPSTLVEESSTAVKYAGTWSLGTCGPDSVCSPDGKLKYTTTGTSKATFTYHGTKADWIASKGPGAGTAKVYVDGVLKTTINLQSNTIQNGIAVYTTPKIASGTHTLAIQRVSARVTIDDFKVYS